MSEAVNGSLCHASIQVQNYAQFVAIITQIGNSLSASGNVRFV
jgi:hypothetical protein